MEYIVDSDSIASWQKGTRALTDPRLLLSNWYEHAEVILSEVCMIEPYTLFAGYIVFSSFFHVPHFHFILIAFCSRFESPVQEKSRIKIFTIKKNAYQPELIEGRAGIKIK